MKQIHKGKPFVMVIFTSLMPMTLWADAALPNTLQTNWLTGYATPQLILYLGLVFGLLYVSMIKLVNRVVHRYNAQFEHFIFNLQLFYTPQQFYESLSLLNPKLRRLYPLITVIDVFVLVLYGLFGFFLSYLIVSVSSNPFYLFVPYLFLCASFCNLLEDALLSFLFLSYPKRFNGLVYIASGLTSGKFICLASGILIMIQFIVSYIFTWQ